FEVDTDKVTQEVESDFAGVLLRITLAEGEAPVGQTIAWIGEPGEEVQEEAPAAAPAPAAAVAATPAAPAPLTSTQVAGALTGTGSTNGGRIKASPLARRLARERGIDLATLRGTGPEGRIVAEDVERGVVGAPAAPAAPIAVPSLPVGEVETIPLSNIRKTIARRLTAA